MSRFHMGLYSSSEAINLEGSVREISVPTKIWSDSQALLKGAK